jgi:hypothetical protein
MRSPHHNPEALVGMSGGEASNHTGSAASLVEDQKKRRVGGHHAIGRAGERLNEAGLREPQVAEPRLGDLGVYGGAVAKQFGRHNICAADRSGDQTE